MAGPRLRSARRGLLSAAFAPGELTALPAVAPASSVAALRVRRSDELAWALNAADYDTSAGRPALVEAILDAEDAPPLLQDLAHAAAAARG